MSPTDPHIQVLYAMMNYDGCRYPRTGEITPLELAKRKETFSRLQRDVASIEAMARTNGHGNYLDLSRKVFAMHIEEELHVGCYPNERASKDHARTAIERFREHVHRIVSKSD
jgi:hypothetical protein